MAHFQLFGDAATEGCRIPESVTLTTLDRAPSARGRASAATENAARGYTFPEGNVARPVPLGVWDTERAFGVQSTPLALDALINVPSQWDI